MRYREATEEPIMSVQLTTELQGRIRSIFVGGRYPDENAVLCEALDLLQRRDELRRDVDAGIMQLEQGEGIDGEEVFARLDRRAAEIERQANAGNP